MAGVSRGVCEDSDRIVIRSLHACSAAGGMLAHTRDELKKCREAANDEMDVGLHGWVHPGAAVT